MYFYINLLSCYIVFQVQVIYLYYEVDAVITYPVSHIVSYMHLFEKINGKKRNGVEESNCPFLGFALPTSRFQIILLRVELYVMLKVM